MYELHGYFIGEKYYKVRVHEMPLGGIIMALPGNVTSMVIQYHLETEWVGVTMKRYISALRGKW